MFRFFSKDTPGHHRVNYKRLRAHSQWLSGADINGVCKDVHLEIAREIVKYKRVNAKAKTEDYEWYVDRRMPQVLSWTRKVAAAWTEGKIEDYEIDRQLLYDIQRVRVMDRKFARGKPKRK